MNDHPAEPRDAGPVPNEPAPMLGSWARVYVLVLAVLLADLVLLWWFTERYR